jgi:uncharacterized membrane protein
MRLFILLFLLIMPAVIAVDISDSDKAQFDEILAPITKIYNLVKYAATAIAGLFLLFAGISYMVAGNDVKKRDDAKSMAGYVIIGLIVIWAAPFVINYLI